jgi:hypothetical protein
LSAKNGSFGFAKGRFVCWAKPNVPFAGWLKLFLKNVRWEKIKNIGSARGVGLLDVPLYYHFYVFGQLSKWFTFFLFVSLVCLSGRCLNTLAANVSRTAAVF